MLAILFLSNFFFYYLLNATSKNDKSPLIIPINYIGIQIKVKSYIPIEESNFPITGMLYGQNGQLIVKKVYVVNKKMVNDSSLFDQEKEGETQLIEIKFEPSEAQALLNHPDQYFYLFPYLEKNIPSNIFNTDRTYEINF